MHRKISLSQLFLPISSRFSQDIIPPQPLFKPGSLGAASVSACLIVKNEAQGLARCLESLADLATEIIVVDTGSTDQTVAIAKQYTDKVFHHAWQDHYAQARNVSLTHATGDYILIIDADEWVPEETVQRIQSYLASPDLQGKPWVLNWRVCSEHHPDLYSRGLFPNGYGIEFVGRVHEVPLLPGQVLPAYHCQDLILWHDSPAGHDLGKLTYYQQLLQQSLTEETIEARLNHIQKHLGLNHLLLAEWSLAWEVLSECYKGLKILGIQPQDGFYGEVLKGLVEAGLKLQHPDLHGYASELKGYYPLEVLAHQALKVTLKQKPWRTAVFAVSLSVLAACQMSNTVPGTGPQTINQARLR